MSGVWVSGVMVSGGAGSAAPQLSSGGGRAARCRMPGCLPFAVGPASRPQISHALRRPPAWAPGAASCELQARSARFAPLPLAAGPPSCGERGLKHNCMSHRARALTACERRRGAALGARLAARLHGCAAGSAGNWELASLVMAACPCRGLWRARRKPASPAPVAQVRREEPHAVAAAVKSSVVRASCIAAATVRGRR